VYPGFLFAATVPHQAVWTITGFTAIFWALLALRSRPALPRAALYGALLGLLLLAEPVFLVLLMIGFAGTLFTTKARGRTALAGAVALGAALLVIAPWLARCYVAQGRFVFVKSSLGFNLWQGNNPACNGTPHSGWTHKAYPAPPELLARLKAAHTELERDDIWRQAALRDMAANPRRTAWLSAMKMAYFWTITPYHQYTRNPLYWAPYALLFVPGVGVLIALRRRWRDFLPVLLIFAAATLIYSTTFTGPRYRMPLEPLLFVFSAQGILVLARTSALRWAPRAEPSAAGGART
jgi:hypothetical protein